MAKKLPPLKFLGAAVTMPMKAAEAGILLKFRARLWEAKLVQEREVDALRQQEIFDWGIETTHTLRGDPAVEHKKYLEWSSVQGVSKSDFVAIAIADSARGDCSVASGLGLGLALEEPSETLEAIDAIPGINPAFVSSLRAQLDIISEGGWLAKDRAAPLTHRDGNAYKFVPAFLDVLPSGTLRRHRGTNCNGPPPEPRDIDLLDRINELESELGTCQMIQPYGYGPFCYFGTREVAERARAELLGYLDDGHKLVRHVPASGKTFIIGRDNIGIEENWRPLALGGPRIHAFDVHHVVNGQLWPIE